MDRRSFLAALAGLPLLTKQLKRSAMTSLDNNFSGLVEDIRVNGVLNPILVTPSGVILDGQRRLLACQILGIRPPFLTLQPTLDKEQSAG